jgi:predicted nucleic acid-binding protein
MTADITVSNTSPLIVFHQIARLDLARAVLGDVWIPPTVAGEIAPSLLEPPPWIQTWTSPFPLDPMPWWSGLDRGEIEVIALALHLSGARVLLDDRPARRAARRLGLKMVGSVGVLLEAHYLGLIESVRPDLDAMIAVGFYLSQALYWEALEIAVEQEQEKRR